METINQFLNNILPKEQIYINEPMSKHTTFKIGGLADYFLKVDDIDDLSKIIQYTNQHNIPVTVIGNGSNVLVTDKGIRGITIKPQFNKVQKEITNDNVIYTVGSGASIIALAMTALQDSAEGLEFASGIPGTVGGAIRMNAGCYGGQMQDVVLSTTYLDEQGVIHTITNEEQQFSYRNSIFAKNNWIIIEAKIQLKKGNKEEIEAKINSNNTSRKEKQPIDKPSAGSVFKRGQNFISAQLIDECGLKGSKIGGAEISTKHAGFIVNTGNATAKDVLDLIEHIKKQVKEKTGFEIEEEIKIIGQM